MTDDPAPRRRRRAAPRRVELETSPAAPHLDRERSAPATGAPAVARRTPGAPRRPLPLLPILASALGLALLTAAWTTRWPPGPPSEAEQATRFTLEIPADRQRVINNWESFFVCYDLRDPSVIELTLRANQRVTGTLDFPREQVVVELPAAGPTPRPPASSAEEELIALRRTILDAAPERLSAIQRQCGT